MKRLILILALLFPSGAWANALVHATDCTDPGMGACDAGRYGTFCYEQDAQTLYLCDGNTSTWELLASAVPVVDTTCDTGDQACTFDDDIFVLQTGSTTTQGELRWDSSGTYEALLLQYGATPASVSTFAEISASAIGDLCTFTTSGFDCRTNTLSELNTAIDGELPGVVTFENLSANSDIGFGASQVPEGDETAELAGNNTFAGTNTFGDIILEDSINLGTESELAQSTTPDLGGKSYVNTAFTWSAANLVKDFLNPSASSELLIIRIGTGGNGVVFDCDCTDLYDDAGTPQTSGSPDGLCDYNKSANNVLSCGTADIRAYLEDVMIWLYDTSGTQDWRLVAWLDGNNDITGRYLGSGLSSSLSTILYDSAANPLTIGTDTGEAERLTFDLDNVANTLTLSSTTGLNTWDFNSMALDEVGGLTSTGVVDFNAATSTAIVSGTADAADAAGEILIDTTTGADADGQLIFYDGTQEAVLTDVGQQCTTIESLAAADDDKPLWMNAAWASVVLQTASCNCIGTCTTEADLSLENDDGSAAAITGTVDCEDTVAGDTATALSGAEATIDFNDVVRFDVTNTPTADDDYIVCLTWKVVRQ